jgi:hypothetical protein
MHHKLDAESASQQPYGGGATFDIWQGQYLGNVRVDIKTMRAVHSSPKNLEVPLLSHYASSLFIAHHSVSNARRRCGLRFGTQTGESTSSVSSVTAWTTRIRQFYFFPRPSPPS